MKERVVAIHQPNYLPWLGYFYKIAHSDVFVFLDDVQFSKNSYQNRVQVYSGQDLFWLTEPVRTKGAFKALTTEICFADESWKERHRKTLVQFYRRHPFFREVEQLLDIFDAPSARLSEFNIGAIRKICAFLGLGKEMVVASELNLGDLNDATERLAHIIRAVKGEVYLSGSGGKKYHDEGEFGRYGIGVKYSDFNSPPYSQIGRETFQPGLSIIDALSNIGRKGVRDMLGAE